MAKRTGRTGSNKSSGSGPEKSGGTGPNSTGGTGRNNPESTGRTTGRTRSKRRASVQDYRHDDARRTKVITALKNGAKFEDVQDAAGKPNPSTTRLYDKRGYDPEKSASFFANY
jgi:hypothetical protein